MYLENLGEFHSSVTSEVQTIESSLDYINSISLITAINKFQHTIQETERIVEQRKVCRYKVKAVVVRVACGSNHKRE